LLLLTGEGYWKPLFWLAAAAGVALLAALLWARGRRDYKRGTDQDLPFLSGERLAETHIGGQHLYWGFVEGLRPYVERLRAVHTGFIGDYMAWLVLMLGAVFLIVLLGG
jgi:hypothetical protein